MVGGFLPFGGILLLAARNLGDASILLFCLVHLAIYGVLLYWLAGWLARLLTRLAADHLSWATLLLMLLLCGVGLLPIFGIAHGQIRWQSAYALYASSALR